MPCRATFMACMAQNAFSYDVMQHHAIPCQAIPCHAMLCYASLTYLEERDKNCFRVQNLPKVNQCNLVRIKKGGSNSKTIAIVNLRWPNNELAIQGNFEPIPWVSKTMTCNARGRFEFSDYSTRGKFNHSPKAMEWLIFPGGEGESCICHDTISHAGVAGQGTECRLWLGVEWNRETILL